VKYLQITNLVLLALGLVLTLVLSVVCLLYSVHLDADPVVRRQLPLVLQFTALLGVFSLASFLAYFGHRRDKAWRWIAQLLPVLAAAGLIVSLIGMRR
jgi:FtsH-binding integral membrane protein